MLDSKHDNIATWDDIFVHLSLIYRQNSWQNAHFHPYKTNKNDSTLLLDGETIFVQSLESPNGVF